MADGGYTIDQLVLDIQVNSEVAQSKIMSLAQTLSGAAPKAKEMGTSMAQMSRSMSQFQKVLERLNREEEQSGEAAKKAAKGHRTFFASIGRVAKLMVLRMAIRAIIKGMKEGLQMFVEWDRTSYGSMAGAANAMDNLKNAATGLKAAFGAFAGQLLTLVEPVLTRIIGWLTDLINIFQQFIALLRGTDKWFEYVGSSASSAAAGAKQLKNVLFGFDELNVLPSANGSGSGSGVTAGTYKPTEYASWLDPIRKLFEQNPDMTFIEKLGAIIGAAAKKVLSWIGEKIVKPAIEWVKEKVVEPIKKFFKETLPNAISDFGSWFSSKWDEFKLNVTTGINNLKDKINKLWDNLPYKWRKPLEDGYNAINRNFFIPFKETIQALIQSAQVLIEFLTSPSKWNKQGVQQLADDFRTIWTTAMFDIERAWQQTDSSVKTGLEGLGKDAKTELDGIREDINKNPVMVRFNSLFNTDGLGTAAGNAYLALQKAANDSPISFPTQVLTGSQISNVRMLSNKKRFEAALPSSIVGKAEGGTVPNVGTLFYAGEAGAEIVANLGHSTGVMNVGQMQEAVANGNAEVVNAVYAMANMVAGAINNKDLDVYLDSAKVGHSITQYQYNQARRGITQGAY